MRAQKKVTSTFLRKKNNAAEEWLDLSWKAQIDVLISLLNIKQEQSFMLLNEDFDITQLRFRLLSKFCTIGDFVRQTLDISWEDWNERIEAYAISIKYSYIAKTPQETIAAYRSVVDLSGKQEPTLLEFHKSLQKVIKNHYVSLLELKNQAIDNLSNQNRLLLAKVDEQEGKIKNLVAALETAKSELIEAEKRIAELQKTVLRLKDLKPADIEIAFKQVKKWKAASKKNAAAFDKLHVHCQLLELKIKQLRQSEKANLNELHRLHSELKSYRIANFLFFYPTLAALVMGTVFGGMMGYVG